MRAIENDPIIKAQMLLYREAVAMAGSRRKACADAERIVARAKTDLISAERERDEIGDELLKQCRGDICLTCGRSLNGRTDSWTCETCDIPF